MFSAVRYLLNVYDDNNSNDIKGIEKIARLYYDNGIYDGVNNVNKYGIKIPQSQGWHIVRRQFGMKILEDGLL